RMAMKIKLLELTDDKARILFEGEGNTYINALAAELLNDPDVDVAQRRQAFKFTDPELVVTTINGRPPLLAVTDAAKRLSSVAEELLRQVKTLDTA
ncbi:DNA-directed RNA polymerase subunit L, partial [Methanoculleus thermophilus]